MKEYEYSFKVKSIEPFINYCIENKYELKEKTNQTRTLFRKNDKTMARITIKVENGNTTKQLDFKDDILSDEILIERRETLPIKFESDQEIESILDFLNYKKDTVLIRERIVYNKNNVIFEIDKYQSPTEELVVAIEGNKEEVDKVYKEINDLRS